MRRRSTLLAVVAVLTLVTSATAELALTKPSALVTLYTSGGACSVAGYAFDAMVTSDGNATLLAVPPKQVFVATSLDWGGTGFTASRLAAVSLVLQNGQSSGPVVLQASALADANGAAGGNVVIPNGLVIRAGKIPCLVALGTAGGFLHGYFTKDK